MLRTISVYGEEDTKQLKCTRAEAVQGFFEECVSQLERCVGERVQLALRASQGHECGRKENI